MKFFPKEFELINSKISVETDVDLINKKNCIGWADYQESK
jgi:hypothetical protein